MSYIHKYLLINMYLYTHIFTYAYAPSLNVARQGTNALCFMELDSAPSAAVLATLQNVPKVSAVASMSL